MNSYVEEPTGTVVDLEVPLKERITFLETKISEHQLQLDEYRKVISEGRVELRTAIQERERLTRLGLEGSDPPMRRIRSKIITLESYDLYETNVQNHLNAIMNYSRGLEDCKRRLKRIATIESMKKSGEWTKDSSHAPDGSRYQVGGKAPKNSPKPKSVLVSVEGGEFS